MAWAKMATDCGRIIPNRGIPTITLLHQPNSENYLWHWLVKFMASRHWVVHESKGHHGDCLGLDGSVTLISCDLFMYFECAHLHSNSYIMYIACKYNVVLVFTLNHCIPGRKESSNWQLDCGVSSIFHHDRGYLRFLRNEVNPQVAQASQKL